MKYLKRTFSFVLAVVMLVGMISGSYAAKSRANGTWDTQKTTLSNMENYVKQNNVKMWVYANKNLVAYGESSLTTKKAYIKKGNTGSGQIKAIDTRYKSVKLGSYWYRLSDFGCSWDSMPYDYVLTNEKIPMYYDPLGHRLKKNNQYYDLTAAGRTVLVVADSGVYVQVLLGNNQLIWVKKSDIFSPTITPNMSYVIQSEKDKEKDPFKIYCLNPYRDSTKSGEKIIVWGIQTFSGAYKLWPADTDKPQYRFRLLFDYKTGFYTIINEKSGLPLDVSGASSANGVKLQQWTRNNTYAQQFQIIKRDDGYEIRSRLGTCIDLPNGKLYGGPQIQMWEPANNKNQRWDFVYPKS